jgi:hypothetical protein
LKNEKNVLEKVSSYENHSCGWNTYQGIAKVLTRICDAALREEVEI